MATLHPNTISKCSDRLAKARRALNQCRAASDFSSFRSYWAEFLIHSGGILNSLEAGSKHSAQGRQWYGGIKRRCRNDPLIKYLHQARNSEEHSMNPTTHYGPRNVSIPVPEGGLYVDKFVANQEFLDNPAEAIRGKMWRKVDGALPTIIETPEGPQLAKVIDDRHGEEFRVPQEHIEKLITNLSPTHVGDLFLSFTEKILSEAQELR